MERKQPAKNNMKTSTEWCNEVGLKNGIVSSMGFCLDVKELIEKVQKDVEANGYNHFKDAYSRALNFVCEQHFPPNTAKMDDDSFFISPTGNCCATDILIEQVKQLQTRLLAVKVKG